MSLRLKPAVVWLALALILIAAAAARLYGINWDGGQHLHPDERFVVMVDNGIQWPHSLAEFFDSATSPLNPYNRGFNNFVYGTLPIFILKLVATLLHRDNYDGALYVGRALSAISDVGSVWLLFLAGRRLYGQGIALLAAAFLALSVLGIQLSHFMAVDTFTVFFLMLSFYFVVRLMQDGGWTNAVLMGLAFGLALACKLSIALVPLLMASALVVRIIQTWPKKPTPAPPIMAGGAEAVPSFFLPHVALAPVETARERTRDAAPAIGSLWQPVGLLLL